MLGSKKCPWHLSMSGALIHSFRQEAQYPISCNALHNWSGQEVERLPQRIPSKRAITASTGMPFTKRESPCRFPLHPPQKCHFFHNTIFHIQFDVTATRTLRLVCICHYSPPSSGFMLV